MLSGCISPYLQDQCYLLFPEIMYRNLITQTLHPYCNFKNASLKQCKGNFSDIGEIYRPESSSFTGKL